MENPGGPDDGESWFVRRIVGAAGGPGSRWYNIEWAHPMTLPRQTRNGGNRLSTLVVRWKWVPSRSLSFPMGSVQAEPIAMQLARSRSIDSATPLGVKV